MLRGRILRELRDEHAQLGLDLRQPRAVPFATGGGLALGVFGHPHVGFELRLLVGERFALASRRVETRVEIGDAPAQPLDAGVRGSRLGHQRSDLGQHLLAGQPGALAVLIEHAEPRACAFAFCRQRRRALAQVRRGAAASRCSASVRRFLAGSGQIAFEPHAIGVAAERVGFDAFEAALQVARPLRALRQVRYPRARRVEFGRHAFEVAAGCRRFRAHLGQLQFDSRQPFAQPLTTLDGRFRSPVRRVQPDFALLQLGAQLDHRFAQSARLNAPRQNRAFALEASARNRTAAGNLLAGQRDDGVRTRARARGRFR